MNKKPEKPKSRRAPAAKSADPIFGAIADHKALMMETDRLQTAMRIARDKAERKHGGSLKGVAVLIAATEDTKLEYEQFDRAGRAERKAAMCMARTAPISLVGAVALITYTRGEIETGSKEDWEDWVPTALKTVAVALTRMEAA